MHVDSDVHRSDIATHSLLGGQHGEESEESEEGQEGEEEGEEEVPCCLNDAFDNLCRRQRRKGRRGPRPSAQCCSEWPRRLLVDDGGRRQNQDHPSRDWLRFGRKVGQRSLPAPRLTTRAPSGPISRTISVFRRRPRFASVERSERKAPALRAGALRLAGRRGGVSPSGTCS